MKGIITKIDEHISVLAGEGEERKERKFNPDIWNCMTKAEVGMTVEYSNNKLLLCSREFEVKPDNLLRVLGMQYNLLQAYRGIFLTSVTFLLGFTLNIYMDGISEYLKLGYTDYFSGILYSAKHDMFKECADMQDKYNTVVTSFHNFIAGTLMSLFSFIIIILWRKVTNSRAYLVWYLQAKLLAYESGEHTTNSIYSDLLCFQNVVARCQKKYVFSFSNKTFQKILDEYDQEYCHKYTENVRKSYMRSTITSVRMMYQIVCIVLLTLNLFSLLGLILAFNLTMALMAFGIYVAGLCLLVYFLYYIGGQKYEKYKCK